MNSFDRNNSHGLLIGVGKRDADAEGMAITARDAAYLKKALQGMDILAEKNIQTLLEEQAGKQNIISALDGLIESTKDKAADLVLIYFSGHGSGARGAYHLICRDTVSANHSESGIAGTTFVEKLSAINCDKMLVLLDCCHSEGMTDSDIPFDSNTLHQKQNRIVLTACAANQVSYLSHPVSVFTYAVIETLGGKFLPGAEKDVKVFDLAMDVRERVVALSREVLKPNTPQQPQLNVLENGQTSNFVLKHHPKGGPQEVRLLQEELKALTTPKGEPLRLDVPKEEDKVFRNWVQNIIITNIATVKDNGVVVQGANGPVEIKQGISGEELNEIFKTFSAENRKLILELVQTQGGDRMRELERKMEEALLQIKDAAKKEELPDENINAPVTINIQHGISVDEAVGKLRTRWREHQLAEIKKDGALKRAYDASYFVSKPGTDQIRLHFNINGFKRFDFAGIFTKDAYLQDIVAFEDSGISPSQNHYDDLCRGTINNGHSLITSKGIYNIQESVVTPMSRVVGQYLFRLLFGESKLEEILREVRNANQHLEIVLHFDTTNPESRQLASLPWESMYCPDIIRTDQPEAERSKKDKGFFVVKTASVVREYHTGPKPKPVPVYERKGSAGSVEMDAWPDLQGKKVNVSVMFLTRNADDLNDTYTAYAYIAQKINSDIHHDFQFEFLNKVFNGQVLYISKSNFIRIVKTPSAPDSFNILHVVSDISDESLKLHFSQEESSTQPIKLSELLDEITGETEFFYDLVVLQAWKEEDPMVYKGFERIAQEMLNLGSRVLSMPYTMHHNEAEKGKAAFFQILYSGLAHAAPLQMIVKKLREDLVSQFAYGFPILYRNETIRIPPGKSETISNERTVQAARQKDQVIKTSGSDSTGTTQAEEGFTPEPSTRTTSPLVSKEDTDPKFKSNLFTRFKNLDNK